LIIEHGLLPACRLPAYMCRSSSAAAGLGPWSC